MLLRRISVQNVRSFLDRQELSIEGNISIIIGPNGGGKNNLLDAIVSMLRRHLFATRYLEQRPQPNNPDYWHVAENDSLGQLSLEKHSDALNDPQIIEVDVEVSQSDIANMRLIKSDRADLASPVRRTYSRDPWQNVDAWEFEEFQVGTRFTYTLTDNQLSADGSRPAAQFLEYLRLVETDNIVRAESKKTPLQLPMIYLPVTRASGQIQSSVSLSNHDETSMKRGVDATSSRSGGGIVQLAIGRIAARYCDLLHDNNRSAMEAFLADDNIKRMTADLKSLGYDWELATIDRQKNIYDIRLKKQGSSFLVGAASSGERELLTYLFAIYALNVRDAVIVVDEPELHLHPRWQKALFKLFEKLSRETGNQFVLATHSPTFVSPTSIQYVSRVYSLNQRSHILRLDSGSLPNAKHLLNIVNSQNNESVFFAEKVVLVEGISDRIVFEKLMSLRPDGGDLDVSLEFISVGGKNLFPAYQDLLAAFKVPSVTIADLDYVQEVGSGAVKTMFAINANKIKSDVIDNAGSVDGKTLVARIDEAIRTGSWTDADATWQYIKSRRTAFKADLDDTEKATLAAFLQSKRREHVFILSEGALEAYLPEGQRSKDTGKLISFLGEKDFFDKMPSCRAELVEILAEIVGPPRPKASPEDEQDSRLV